MEDVFLQRLKKVNISANAEKTKMRMANIWENAPKENRKELLNNASPTIYNAITKISDSGRITAKMTVLLSRHLDVNPFYLIGASDNRGNYSESLLKKFLLGLGYDKLWSDYEQFLNPSDVTNDTDTEMAPLEGDNFAATLAAAVNKLEMERAAPAESVESVESVENVENVEEAEPEISQADLSEEEMMVLMRALMIRAKTKPEAAKAVEQIKKLLLN